MCSWSATGSPRSAPGWRRRPEREEIDATGGIVMPGMIDTHRHLWQTAMRGYGADWTLTQYFVWYYLEHGRRSGRRTSTRATCSARGGHRRRRHHHRRLVARAPERRPRGRRRRRLAGGPGRFVLAYGNIQAGPWEWTAHPRSAGSWRTGGPGRRPVGRPAGLRRHRRPVVPGAGGVRGGPRPRAAGDHPRRRLGRHQRRRHPADARERLRHPGDGLRPCRHARHDSYLRIAASGGSISVSTESEQSAGQGTRPPGRCAVTTSRSRCRWTPASGGAATCSRRCGRTLGADRAREHLEAHVAGETVTSAHLRAEHVVDWATRGGAQALGRDDLGSLEPGKKADLVLIKNDHSPVSFPLLNPYGHVAFQAQRGDVHTVLIDGRIVKRDHQLVGVDLAEAAARGRVDRRLPARRAGRGRLAGGHAPGPADGRQGAGQPVHLHRVPPAATREARESIFGEPASS